MLKEKAYSETDIQNKRACLTRVFTDPDGLKKEEKNAFYRSRFIFFSASFLDRSRTPHSSNTNIPKFYISSSSFSSSESEKDSNEIIYTTLSRRYTF